MIFECSFTDTTREHQKCHIALCDDSLDTIKETVSEYWKRHGVGGDDYGSFIFHRNGNNELVALTACTKINPNGLEHCLSCFQQVVGVRISVPDLMRITKELEKYESSEM